MVDVVLFVDGQLMKNYDEHCSLLRAVRNAC